VLQPLLTLKVHNALQAAARAGVATIGCSLDLDRSTETVEIGASGWMWRGRSFPYLDRCKERTIYYWTGTAFEPAARFTTSLIKLVPTDWGPPTFEIDGIKMLPTAHVSPYADAQRKVALVQPRDKMILDTCGGLGYFAACALASGARQVASFEKSADVMWLRTLNPWSPENSGDADDRLNLAQADIVAAIVQLPEGSVDAVLHDPPRFGIAGELYSADFYRQLARVLRRKGLLFHYTGAPNALTSGRDVPREVARRLQAAGFAAELNGDGVLARRT
jgi:uncharacterized protein